eukprot:scaffold1594_cov401-Prasinococcus_capsulatus_cf.AAC.14
MARVDNTAIYHRAAQASIPMPRPAPLHPGRAASRLPRRREECGYRWHRPGADAEVAATRGRAGRRATEHGTAGWCELARHPNAAKRARRGSAP